MKKNDFFVEQKNVLNCAHKPSSNFRFPVNRLLIVLKFHFRKVILVGGTGELSHDGSEAFTRAS